MSHDYVEDTYRAADAFNRRDLDAYLEFLDPAVELRPLVGGMEGSYHGYEGIWRYWLSTFRHGLVVHTRLYMSQSEALEASGLSA